MKILTAGPLQVGYENGFLRRISYGGNEVLRMIYFALRDHNWDTLPGTLTNEVITTGVNSFQISYDYLNSNDGRTVMTWTATINGQADGTIVFEIAGTVTEDLRKNRAGFCILHPLNVVDQVCTLRHPDKSQSSIPFPRDVAPDNPFRQIESMVWKSDGLPFTLQFKGDVFETEDQRNWGDASFKTFCTPLDKPFPVALKKGEQVFQRVTFRSLGPLPSVKAREERIVLTRAKTANQLPAIGIGASTECPTLPDAALERLRPLRLQHYRVDLHPGNSDWVTEFSRFYEAGFAAGIPLEVALHLTDNFSEELEAFAVLCLQNKVKVRKVLLLEAHAMVTGQPIIERIPQLKAQLPAVLFGMGTNYNFNELNKNRFQGQNGDFISFAMDPQEHATDDLTILENAASLEYLVKSARAIYGAGRSVHLSPLTLRRRFNPYATNPDDLYIEESRKADPRQKDALAAVWTFACLCSLAKANADAVTLFQTVGYQGILSSEGKPYPVYDVIRHFASFQKRSVNVCESSDPLAVQGIVLGKEMLGLANLTTTTQTVRWADSDIVLQPAEVRFVPSDGAKEA